jgi:Putative bacterial sensory transduction regulator
MTPKLDLPAVADDDAAQLLDVQYIDIIQTVIGSLDPNHTAMVSGNANSHLWKFSYGSVEVFVQLSGETDEDILTVWADVLTLPVKNQPDLLEKLLQLNWDRTLEARFAISDNRVVAMSTRSVAELSPGEISRAITLVADVADTNDDELKAAFPSL